MRELRDYQTEAVEAVRREHAAGVLRPAVVMATGLGKTDVIAKLATDEAAAGGRVLALAHRDELLNQIRDRCRMHRPDIAVGRVQASTDQRGYPITVAMTPTLANEARRDRMPPPSLVIYDECHHAASPSSVAIMQWAGTYEATRAVGVTATLVRGDKRGPGLVWQSVAYERDIPWAVQSGWLVRPRGRVVVADHVDLGSATVRNGDYADGELGDMVEQDTDQIVKAWLKHASDRITVAFTPNVASAEALRDEFEAAGIKAEAVFGKTSTAERAGIYARLADGVTRVLVGVMVATEGWDCPPVSCVLQCRPTKLRGLYAQMVGRGLRLSPGKTDCLVLDVVGATRGQSLATLVDLSPGSEYDTSSLDDLPCGECGGYSRRQVAAGLGSEPCSCPPAERDPDGGRRRLPGPAEYEELDLLAEPAQQLWLRTRAGVPFLPAGDRMAVLWPDSGRLRDSPTWTAGHMALRGPLDPTALDGAVPHGFGEAREIAEAWALAYGRGKVGAAVVRGRGGRPNEAQLGAAYALGIARPERLDRARLADAIMVARVSPRLDRTR